jgi:phospho-N-acetylmuramoyl-pentapeptide-transferase
MLSQIHLFMCTAYFCLAFWEAGRKGCTFLKKSVAFCEKTKYTENVENEKRVNKIDWEVRIMRLVLLTALGIGGATVIGALLGFMWYNCFPAQVFMGDTGSLAIGGVIAVFALLIRKDLLLPILCGIFLVESLSVIIQRSYFKYTKKKYGEGRRVFLMSPIHHHYQKRGFHESKIVVRAIIIGVLLAAITLSTLKVR